MPLRPISFRCALCLFFRPLAASCAAFFDCRRIRIGAEELRGSYRMDQDAGLTNPAGNYAGHAASEGYAGTFTPRLMAFAPESEYVEDGQIASQEKGDGQQH